MSAAPIIPLISPSTAGPLGVLHLPRLWLKGLLAGAGRLPAGYKDVRPGFDYMVLEGLGADPDAVRSYLAETQPSYPQFEAWLAAQPGVDLSPENVARVNRAVTERTKGPESRRALLAELGLPPDAPLDRSVILNDLEDWRAVHAQVTAG